jgi:hypothetical protein
MVRGWKTGIHFPTGTRIMFLSITTVCIGSRVHLSSYLQVNGVRRQGCTADLAPPYGAEFKNTWIFT